MRASCIGSVSGLLLVVLSMIFCSLLLGRGSVPSKVLHNATKCTFLAIVVDITVLTAALVPCIFYYVIVSLECIFFSEMGNG